MASAKIYDFSGKLLQPTSVPRVPSATDLLTRTTYRDRYRSYPSVSLTPERLAAILNQADLGYPSLYIEASEEFLEKDGKLGSIFGIRYASVTGTDYEIMPSDDSPEAKQYADEVRAMIKAVNFDELIFNQLDAIAKPFAVTWINWDRATSTPVGFQRVSQRNFRWSTDLKQLLMYANDDDFEGTPIPPYQAITSIWNTRHDHPTRSGLMRPIAWLYLFKNMAVKDWVNYVERFGMPFRWMEVPTGLWNNEDETERLRLELSDMGTNASGLVPQGAKLNVTQQTAGSTIHADFVEKIDTWLAQIVLGHELSSQGSRGGIYGVSAANQVRQDIYRSDCEQISKDLKRDLFTPFILFQHGVDAIKLCPYISFKYEQSYDTSTEATTIQTLGQTFPDLTISEEQVREKFDVREPKDDNDTLKFAAKNPPPGLGGGGIGGGVAPDMGGKNPASAMPGRGGMKGGKPAEGGPNTGSPRLFELGASMATDDRQRELDQLTAQAVERTKAELANFEYPIEQVLKQARLYKWPLKKITTALEELFPDLDARILERELFEKAILARLRGDTN